MKKVRLFFPYETSHATDGAGIVTRNLIKAIRSLNYQVDFYYWLGPAQQATDSFDLREQFEIHQSSKFSRVLKSLFSDLASPELYYYPGCPDLSRLKEPAINIFTYSFSYSWLHDKRFRPAGPCVVYIHNLESQLFKERAKTEKNIIKKWIHSRNAQLLENHEIELFKIVDCVWQISHKDLLKNPAANQCFVPPIFTSAPPSAPDRSPSHVLGFMGALDFGPNQDSLHWILDQIVPTLNSEWTFEVIGKSAPRALIEKMKAHSQVKYLGFVQDLAKTTDRWRALLAPNVSGSGTRIKIFEALSMGMPVFTTTRTLETMPGFTHDHLFASDSPRAWLDHLNGNVHSKASENLDLHDWAMSYLKLALNKVEQTHVS